MPAEVTQVWLQLWQQNIQAEMLLFANDKTLVKYSKAFTKETETLKQKGYIPVKAIIQFIVYWKNEEDKEIQVILPEIVFRKTT